MRKRDDFPQPLGPTTRRWSPCLRENERALTRTSPLGEMMGLLELAIQQHERWWTSPNLHIDKLYVFALHHDTSPLEYGFIVFGARARDKLLLKAAGLNIVHDIEESGDT